MPLSIGEENDALRIAAEETASKFLADLKAGKFDKQILRGAKAWFLIRRRRQIQAAKTGASK